MFRLLFGESFLSELFGKNIHINWLWEEILDNNTKNAIFSSFTQIWVVDV